YRPVATNGSRIRQNSDCVPEFWRIRLRVGIVALISLVVLQVLNGSSARAEGLPDYLTSRPRPAAAAVAPIRVGEEIRTVPGERRRVLLPDGSVVYVNQNSRVKLEKERQLNLAAGEILVEVAPRPEGRIGN